MSFSKLGLTPSICLPLARLGYEQPTPIQPKAIPAVLTGVDLLARAQTGTGKTAAFGLPMIDRLVARRDGARRRLPRGLVLVPTRELAVQVHQVARDLRRAGAAPRRRHLRRRRHGAADPGAEARRRHRRRHARPADRPHAAAHGRSLRDRDPHAGRSRSDAGHGLSARAATVVASLPRSRQTLLFSATLSDAVVRLAARIHARRRRAWTSRTGRSSRRP